MLHWPTLEPEVRKHFVRIANREHGIYPSGKKKEVRAMDPELFDEITRELRRGGGL